MPEPVCAEGPARSALPPSRTMRSAPTPLYFETRDGARQVAVKKKCLPAFAFSAARGRQKTKIGDPRGGWVGQRPKKDQGQICFFDIRFFFLTHLTEKRPKPWLKNQSRKSIGFGFLGDFCCESFSTRFFVKRFFGIAFELPSLRNTRKRDKTKQKIKGKLTSKNLSVLLEKVFDGLFVKHCAGVFELPLLRSAQKRTKKRKGKGSRQVFELPSLRNTRKRDKTKKSRGKTDIEILVNCF
jgi:hypothetical protein